MTALEPVGDKSLYVAASVQDAVAALVARGPNGAPLAGATWIMRSPIRQEHGYRAVSYVGIGGIEELRRIDITEEEIAVGACVTHAELFEKLAGLPDGRGLQQAAGGAANPAVRRVATIGGNLCTSKFAASDLVPAFLAAGAEVELVSPAGIEKLPMERFLVARPAMDAGTLLSRVILKRGDFRSAHVRLPLRRAGDYPVAVVSIYARLDAGGAVAEIRIAVGSVEPAARRWERLETAMTRRALDAEFACAQAQAFAGDFTGRDAVEAPGWYRVQVLPSLVRKAVLALRTQA